MAPDFGAWIFVLAVVICVLRISHRPRRSQPIRQKPYTGKLLQFRKAG